MTEPDDGRGNPLDALPGIARIAAVAYLRTLRWGAETSIDTTRRMLRAAVSPETATHAVHQAREMAESAEIERRVREVLAARTGDENGDNGAVRSREREKPEPRNQLHDRGDELMAKSRDVRYEEEAHPAYERILGELAPDEGRILRLLLLSGPQAAVDVRTGGPLGYFNSRLLAPGLSMIGPRSGVRYLDRVPSYLNNLYRLGLVWFSRETLRDVHRYQVLEAQPDVLEAVHSVKYAKLVRRSIHLTPFGADFCRVCLKLTPVELEDLPIHASPLEAEAVATPPDA